MTPNVTDDGADVIAPEVISRIIKEELEEVKSENKPSEDRMLNNYIWD